MLMLRPGLYEQQDPNQREHNLRGIFHTDTEGRYAFYCLKPTPYPVPTDGPAGKLLQMMDRPIYRPAHIHLMVSHNTKLCSAVVLWDLNNGRQVLLTENPTGSSRGPQAPHHSDLRQGLQVPRE